MPASPHPRAWSTILALFVLAALCGCDKSSGDTAPAQTYVVRGLVKVMPGERQEIEIHHEAIPDFVNYSGKKVGMMAMTMPFGLQKGLDVGAVAVGDKVEFGLAVDWNRKPSGYLTSIRKLPADTQLSLER